MSETTEQRQPSSVSRPWFNYLKIGTKPGKIPELDGMRALAILMVLLFHFATYYQGVYRSYYLRLFPDTLKNLMQNGWLGVDLFFVLSGFLIFRHLLSADRQSHKKQLYGRYALKRILRTFPLYYAIIILVALGLIPYYQRAIDASDYLIHLLFLQDYLDNNILIPLWSLATEEKFYLLAPLLLLLLKKGPLKSSLFWLFLTMLGLMIWRAVAVAQVDAELNYGTFFTQFRAPFHFAVVSIAVGVAVALLSEKWPPAWLPVAAWLATLMLLVVLFFADLYTSDSWLWTHWIHFLAVVLFGLLMWAAVTYSGARWMRFLCGRALRVISVLSYALYLTHYTVLPWVFRLHRQHIYSEEGWIHASTFLVIYIAVTVVFSLILHYVIEKPFLLLKDRL